VTGKNNYDEGLSEKEIHPLQDAWMSICASCWLLPRGQIMTAAALLAQKQVPNDRN